jgi:predicted PurR-regulated permease PerM
MTDTAKTGRPATSDIIAWILACIMLVLILKLHLLGALISGFLVYEIVHSLSPYVTGRYMRGSRAKAMVVALLSVIVIAILISVSWGAISFLRSGTDNVYNLFRKMAEIIGGPHRLIPDWLMAYIPQDAEGMKQSAIVWLNQHAYELPIAGKQAARGVAMILIGMVIGVIVSLSEVTHDPAEKPFTMALSKRVYMFHMAFRRIVFAQVRISALNTFFTWLYIGVALPVLGIHLPFAKTLIALTFVVGLIPIIGNLISNTVIVVVSMSISLGIAVSSLVFLIVIHKLEYFLNAKIVGTQINSRAWELLVTMIFMEAAFGIPGVIAAPIYYAYLKSELSGHGII